MKVFVNLTNGLDDPDRGVDDGFVRIQSTHLEQKRWDLMIRDLDYNFLAAAARGEVVSILDCTAAHKPWGPRSMWQGVPIIRYVLHHEWGGDEQRRYYFKDMNVTRYLRDIVMPSLLRHDDALRKIRYFKRLSPKQDATIVGLWSPTDHDGDDAYWRKRFHDVLQLQKKEAYGQESERRDEAGPLPNAEATV